MTAPTLVGRLNELRRLSAALDRAAGGQGAVVFLSGEPGIGKTRLAHEALTLARGRGFLALEGRAYPLEGRLAYAPILAALGPSLRRLDSARQARLVSGLPDLSRLFADLHLRAPEPLGDPALEKTRLFEAVARLVERLAQQAPVVLFLDDLHWADPASIELLHYLARGLVDQAVLVLGTYRAEDVDAARGLRSLVTSLRRAGLAEELVLARLGPEAIAELANGLLGGQAPGELLALLDKRAAGTPLFTEALIGALIDAGSLVRSGGWSLDGDTATVLPPGVRDLMLERLERLGATERRVLEFIAVGGEAVPHLVLHAASGLDDEVLLTALRRLRGMGLVAEELAGPDVSYTLTHPLLQEVTYTELSEMARRLAHAAHAAALERSRPAGSSARSGQALDRLAQHYRLAGAAVDPDRALEVLLAAGEQAHALFANDQAARHFGAALALVREGRRIELLPVLLERLGEAWERVGETAAAVAVWAEALAEHERATDAVATAQARRRLALVEWDRGHFDSAEAHLNAGVRVLAESGSSPALADLLHARVIVLGRLGDFDGVLTAAEDLAALAERLGSPRVSAEAHLARVWPRSVRWDLVGALEEAQQGLSAAERAEEPLVLQRAHDLLALLFYVVGDHALARHHANRSLALAQHLGAPTLELFPRNRLVSVDLMAGSWDEAWRRSGEVVAMARRLGSVRGIAGALSLRALVHVYQGELDDAAACLAETHEVFGGRPRLDRNIFSQVVAAEMMLCLERGDAAGALAAAQRLDQLPAASGLQLLALALVGEAQVMVGEPERALGTARDLVAHAPPGNNFAAAVGSRVEGLARRALEQPAAAQACLERAIHAFTAAQMPFEIARARLEWALCVTAMDPAAATAAAQESFAAFEHLGAHRYAKRARRLLYKLGVRPRGLPRPRSGPTPLSPRELEVVRLVAEDLTNAEIAERLVISPRTVTTHLDRIYARLGINSRTALVRYALEAGLLRPGESPAT